MKRAETPAAQLIAALLAFADKRGHWPGCWQSKRIGAYTRLAPDRVTEIVSPCSPRCRRARRAVEAAGGKAAQKIGRAA